LGGEKVAKGDVARKAGKEFPERFTNLGVKYHEKLSPQNLKQERIDCAKKKVTSAKEA